MHSSNRLGWRRRTAALALLLGASPLALVAQIRRPDPAPGPRATSRSSSTTPKRRTEFLIGGGMVGLSADNATKSSMPMLSAGYRRQLSPDWLHVGGAVDLGKTTVDGEYFPYEKRPVGDSLRFFAVDGSATMVALRGTADAIFPMNEAGNARLGGGISAGVYAMMPSGAGGSTFAAPTFGGQLVGEYDLTPKWALNASVGFVNFTGFDRDKLRPSDPAKGDAVFLTPLVPPPDAKKSFGGTRAVLGVAYRFGVKTVRRSAR